MPFVVWSGAIATAREKHIAQVGLTRSGLDDSCVHADNSFSRNSCNTLPPPPRLAAVWSRVGADRTKNLPRRLKQVAADALRESERHGTYLETYMIQYTLDSLRARKDCEARVGANARSLVCLYLFL